MDKIGPYQIIEVIHRGPQPLFRARAKDGQEVAIKAIPVAELTPEMRERFTREALTCRNLRHPNLIHVYEMGESDGMLFQAMEMLEGSDLGKVLGEGRVLDWDARLSIMEQVAAGLQFAHDQHLVHRDIKPANLFLEDTGRVRVLDFGMVRVAESQLTKVGASVGTLNYMAPEQIRGERCTAATDVFSAGIVFFQLATGKHPFSARDRSLGQVVSAIVFETPPKLSELAPDAPEGLEFILERALEKDPAKRPQNAGELKQAISLCRIAGQMSAPPARVDAGETRVLARPEVEVAGEKTKVMPRAAAASQQVAEDAGKTRVMSRGPAPGSPPASDIDEKTRVLARPPAAGKQAAADDLGEKTKVMQRSSPAPIPAPVAAPKASVKAPAAAPAPKVTGPKQRYCPACTSANPAGAEVCERCGTPFAGGGPQQVVAAKTNTTALYVAIGVAVLLAIALVAVLILK
ncbi:MAG: protein kinase [Candidatus Solibacter sp.]